MLSKQSRFIRQIRMLAQIRYFSANDKDGSAEWGIKYNDDCLKFEKEWKQIADKIETEQSVYIEKELSELQRKKVDMLTDKMLDLNKFYSIQSDDQFKKWGIKNIIELKNKINQKSNKFYLCISVYYNNSWTL